MIAELARFSLGRVLLHLIAMLGDRAVRFHAAGIARELSWVAGATALLAQVHTRLVDAFSALPRAAGPALQSHQIVPVQIAVRDAWTVDHRHVTPRDFASAPLFEVVSSTQVDWLRAMGIENGAQACTSWPAACGRSNSLMSSDTGTRTR
jgi:hypothetical protein